MLEATDARGNSLYEAIQAGLTLKEIADFLGLTRQAVQQSLIHYSKRHGLQKPIRLKPARLWECQVCHKPFAVSTAHRSRMACSPECLTKMRYENGLGLVSTKFVEVELICAGCGQSFWRTKNLINIHNSLGCKRSFCTQKCYTEHELGRHRRVRHEASG